MKMLVAVAQGEPGERLLADARMVAHAIDAGLRVLHVKEDPAGPDLTLPPRLTTNVAVEERVGDPVMEIVEAAEEVDVLGFALRGARDECVGSVSQALLAGAPTTLLVTPPGAPPMTALRRVLVPLEGSPSSSEAMRQAEELLCRKGREILVLHVGTSASPTEPGSFGVPRIMDQEQYEWPAWHDEFRMRFSSCPRGGRHRTLVEVGDPAETILAQALKLKAQLIVLAWSRDVGEGKAQLVRSLLCEAPCPLLLVPAAA
jgi:nucleotide-binding universal stress UspA family protein